MSLIKNRKSTKLFYLEIYLGHDFLEKRMLNYETQEDGNYCSAGKINGTKIEICNKLNVDHNDASMKFVDVWRDENELLFYYTWDDSVGNVKTLI